MVIWGIAKTPEYGTRAGEMKAPCRVYEDWHWIPGLGLPVVTASEPACAGTPERGLPTGVDFDDLPPVVAVNPRDYGMAGRQAQMAGCAATTRWQDA